ncbi:hypothetical protein CVT24_013241 [Panaeolus cyanescens]|uniref:HNH nuclease domain-containing protein n=1 Tax=Panaeolus cyanescens TaxID=181874 RepID=A0A409WAM4_9AGAR|nr:hypothetical protein CVT24_013241 [Panaeolus cyanescens]
MALQHQVNFKPFLHNHPIPPNPFSLDTQSDMYRAYQRCVVAFDQEESKGNAKCHYIAFVACLIFYITEENVKGQKKICDDISSAECQSDEQLINLGIFYAKHLVGTFHKARTTAKSADVNHPIAQFNVDANDWIPHIDLSTKHRHKIPKREALLRDRCHCMLTGQYDPEHIGSMSLSEAELNFTKETGSSATTQLTHIFPRTLTERFDPQENSTKLQWISRVCQLIYVLWDIDARDISEADRLTGDGIHQLRNVMTLSKATHSSFDELALWCNSNERCKPNEYIVEAAYPIDMISPRTWFRTRIPEYMDQLPSRRFLKVHAVVCQAFQRSLLENVHRKGLISEDINNLPYDPNDDWPITLSSPELFNRHREALPHNPYNEQSQEEQYAAYSKCFEMGTALNQDEERELGRVLVFLILEAPNEAGRLFICREVNMCQDRGELRCLADIYVNYMVLLFHNTAKGSTFRDNYVLYPINTDEHEIQVRRQMAMLEDDVIPNANNDKFKKQGSTKRLSLA